MDFQHYNPKRLVSFFKESGVRPYSDRVCQGCVFTHIPPTDCIHPADEFSTPSVQSDMFCMHCVDTINYDGEPFHLHEDKELTKKVAELGRIMQMVFGY